jgi:hypothetical protein
LSNEWLTIIEWEEFFDEAYGFMTIDNKNSRAYYMAEDNKEVLFIFFTTARKINGEEKFYLMAAVCQLISPPNDNLPPEAEMGNSIIIKSILNFGELNKYIEPYDLTFDEQTMDSDIHTLAALDEFSYLSDILTYSHHNAMRNGYIGHFTNYKDFLTHFKKKLNQAGEL